MITLEELTERLPVITASVFTIGLILLILALRLFRRSRGARYWIYRRRASQRGFRMLIFAMLFLSLSFGLCIATLIFNAIETEPDTPTQVVMNSTATSEPTTQAPTISPSETLSPTHTPTQQGRATTQPSHTSTLTPTNTNERTSSPTPSPTITSTTALPSPTETLTQTLTMTASSTPTASATSTPSPITPTATATQTSLPTLSSSVVRVTPRATPLESAQLRIIGITETMISEEENEPNATFSVGIRRIFFLMHYQNMNTGVLWGWRLLKDNNLVAEQFTLWGPAGNGETSFFIGQQKGFDAGNYELQLFIGEETSPIEQATFRVVP
ncbi:MAG: hypothetical protein CUN55_01185 [Phototrophicales bacterium]|nr:MAG: hypothetical protein CUN55_01185 [Phototrophicales bacterium]